MTREQIMAVEGRGLDAAVAEFVMGWHTIRELVNTGTNKVGLYGFPPGVFGVKLVPRYSIDIAMAWQVVHKMLSLGWHLNLQSLTSDGTTWSAMFERPGVYEIYRGPSPEAICKAALLAHFTDALAAKNGGVES